ncbi:MAG TPA: hypothetical protein VF043_00565 [Ktedonobacteraceae bacterium]
MAEFLWSRSQLSPGTPELCVQRTMPSHDRSGGFLDGGVKGQAMNVAELVEVLRSRLGGLLA